MADVRLHAASQGARLCSKCKVVKPADAFYYRNGRPRAACKRCTLVENRRGRLTPEGERRASLRKTFSFTQEEYERLYDAQQGCCRICGSFRPRWQPTQTVVNVLVVDHEHLPPKGKGPVRGLLCNTCNVGLGAFRDSPELLCAAITYLCRYHDPVVWSGLFFKAGD